LSGIVPRQRNLEIGLRQSASGLSGLTMAAISPPDSRPYPIGPAEVPRSASEAGTPSLPDGVPNVGAGSSSVEEILELMSGCLP
jgi:hypothetical protein